MLNDRFISIQPHPYSFIIGSVRITMDIQKKLEKYRIHQCTVGGSASETPPYSPSPYPSSPLVTSYEVAALVNGSIVLVDDLFEADLDKLLHLFAESI